MASKPATNVATFASTRRSERKKPVRHPHPYDGIQDIQAFTEENMKKEYPGMHCVLVDKVNSIDPKAASPLGWYKGNGYKELSTDPQVTGHENTVLMGIKMEDWLEREDNRVADDNERLSSLIDGAAESLGGISAVPGFEFVRSQSGITEKPPMQVQSNFAEAGD